MGRNSGAAMSTEITAEDGRSFPPSPDSGGEGPHEPADAGLAPLLDQAKKRATKGVGRGRAMLDRLGAKAQLPRFPWLGRVGRTFRERSRSDVLDRDYRRFLRSAHRVMIDRWGEGLFFTPTAGRVPLRQLHVRSINRIAGSDYLPTPLFVFDWAMEAIPESPREFVFVDYGAGRGRVMLLAAQRPFRKVLGVEFAEELHNDAVMNIAQFPRSRMRCRDVECVLEDAVRFDPPPNENAVLYFFNPFGPRVFSDALMRIVESYRANPRRLYIVLVDPVLANMVDETGMFQPVRLMPYTQTKVRLFSPYDIAVYRSLA